MHGRTGASCREIFTRRRFDSNDDPGETARLGKKRGQGKDSLARRG